MPVPILLMWVRNGSVADWNSGEDISSEFQLLFFTIVVSNVYRSVRPTIGRMLINVDISMSAM
jgi:hypothetical protein